MKKQKLHRMASLLLSIAMLAGLFSVSLTSVQAEERIARKMIGWKGQQLADEAAKTGLVNRQGFPIFTTYQDQIGVQAPKGINDYVIHSWPVLHTSGDQSTYSQGDMLTMVLRVWNPDDDLEDGEFVTPELCYDWSGVNIIYGETMTAQDYRDAETFTDETYGYQYKECILTAVLEDKAFDNTDLLFQIRVRSHGSGTLNLYGLTLENDTGDAPAVLAQSEGQFAGQSNIATTPVTAGNTVTGIVSYAGETYAGRGEPYSVYNANGIQGCGAAEGQTTDIVSDPDGALLLHGLGGALSAGQYAAEFTFATQYSLGIEKASFAVMQGANEVASFDYTLATLNEHLGTGKDGLGGLYDTVRLDFTVDEAHAGQEFTVKVVVVNRSDFYLRSIDLLKLVSADAKPAAETQALLDTIAGLGYTSAPQQIADASEAIGRLALDERIWIDEAVCERLDFLEASFAKKDEVIQMINAIGEVTEENYVARLSSIEDAEAALSAYDKAYPDAAGAISNRDILTEARAQYNAFYQRAEQAKQEAAQAVILEIDKIGEVTRQNFTQKLELYCCRRAGKR